MSKSYYTIARITFGAIITSNLYTTLSDYDNNNTDAIGIWNNHRSLYLSILGIKSTIMALCWPYALWVSILNPKHVFTFGGKYKITTSNPSDLKEKFISIVPKE